MSTAHLLTKEDVAREFCALNDARTEDGFHLGITARPCNFSDGRQTRDGCLSRVWEGTVVGPAGSPYEDQPLDVKVVLPDSYPKEGPTLWFTQEVFHPSVTHDGLIALSILGGGTWPCEWPVGSTIAYALECVQRMLADPCDNDRTCVTVNEEAENLALRDWDAFVKTVKSRRKDTHDFIRAVRVRAYQAYVGAVVVAPCLALRDGLFPDRQRV
eukprot:TRINITY_DN16114_c0_g1_i2.p1 TRINITY_DN16114_c0_g1~~TRINITY_DN16114_c0_g1_i2.p1  ORF type:complete len:214 (-),score=27.05 TRINITY_DN16114_c0_g1_i2:193-834(-)